MQSDALHECTEGVQKHFQCAVCFDSFGTHAGFACTLKCGTFTCWDCLLQSYIMAGKPGAVQGCSNMEGELLCTNFSCRSPLNVVALARGNASEDVLKAQEAFKVQVLTSKSVAHALSHQEHRIRAEYARIEQIKNADEKAAVKLRFKIVDEALTLRCPRCKVAFVDFDGCYAVNCGNNNCRCDFCAWCLKDCGRNAHSHVLQCFENPSKKKDYFNTEAAFQQHHTRKRIAAVIQLLHESSLSQSAVEKLKVLVKKDLADLHIQLRDVFPATALSEVESFMPTCATHQLRVVAWPTQSIRSALAFVNGSLTGGPPNIQQPQNQQPQLRFPPSHEDWPDLAPFVNGGPYKPRKQPVPDPWDVKIAQFDFSAAPMKRQQLPVQENQLVFTPTQQQQLPHSVACAESTHDPWDISLVTQPWPATVDTQGNFELFKQDMA